MWLRKAKPGKIRTGQPDGGKPGNWIQTVSGKAWFVILRLYSPLEPFFDKNWRVHDKFIGGVDIAPNFVVSVSRNLAIGENSGSSLFSVAGWVGRMGWR